MNRKNAVTLIAGGLAVALTVWGYVAWNAARFRNKILDATVYIETTDEAGHTAFGSGFFVSPRGDVLTNLHVVEKAKTIRIKTRTGETCGADLFFFDKQNDAARLKAHTSKAAPFLKVRAAPPRKNEEILAAGAPWGFEQTISEGLISAVAEDPERGPYIQITANIAPGSSGGPVVDRKGEVVGMATLIYAQAGETFGYAAAAPILRELVANESGLMPEQMRELKALETKHADADMDAAWRDYEEKTRMRFPSALEEAFPGITEAADSPSSPPDEMWKLMELQRRERQEAERNRESDPFSSALEEKLDAQDAKVRGYDDLMISEDQEGYLRELTALHAMQNERRAPPATSLPLPAAEGFLDNPWGSSVPAVKERLPWLAFGGSQDPDRRVLSYNIPGLYEVFDGGGKFTVSLIFYDNRLGRIAFVLLPGGGGNPSDPIVRELTSRFGSSPRKADDRRGNFTTYVWERNGLRATVNAPREDAERPSGGGTMSFYAFTVQFDYPGITGPFERRR